jgi:hypothetical protein
MKPAFFKPYWCRKNARLNLTLDIYLNKNIMVNVKGLIRTVIFPAPLWA